MGIKAVLKPDHINTSSFSLAIAAILPITFTSISGIEEQIDVAELPDRTVATGGQTQPVEFTAMQPLHHSAEYAVMETWYLEAQDPVSLTYKKAGTLQMRSISGAILRTYMLSGLWISARKLPDLDMDEAGEMAQVEWTFRADQVIPL